MVKISIEVRSATTRFRAAVRAKSIQRAVGLVGERFPTPVTKSLLNTGDG